MKRRGMTVVVVEREGEGGKEARRHTISDQPGSLSQRLCKANLCAFSLGLGTSDVLANPPWDRPAD